MSDRTPDFILLESDPAIHTAVTEALSEDQVLVHVSRFSELVKAISDFKDRPEQGYILGNMIPEDGESKNCLHTNLVYFLRDVVGTRTQIVICTDSSTLNRETAAQHYRVSILPRETSASDILKEFA